MNADDDSEEPAADPDEVWLLRLYVAGQSPTSLRAIANLKALCEEYLAFRLLTQYGYSRSRASSADVVNYLTWCRGQP